MTITRNRRFGTVTGMAKQHLLSQGFALDGSDPIIDIHDAVYAFVLADQDTVNGSMHVEDAYQLIGSYEELAEIITENLA